MSAVASPHARRHPMSVVTQARRFAEAGWAPRKIVSFFADDGVIVSERTVARWIDPALLERDRLRDERRRRRASAQRSGRLAAHITNPTAEFKFARLRALRDEAGMTCGGIAKVMRFDFGDPLTERQVRHALDISGRYPEAVA